MKGTSIVAEAMRKLSNSMHQADPRAEFAFELWNGQTLSYGGRPKRSCA